MCLPFLSPQLLFPSFPAVNSCRAAEWPLEILLPSRGAQSRETFQAAPVCQVKMTNIYRLWTPLQVLLYSRFYFILYFRKQDFFPHEQVQIPLTFITFLKGKD